MPKHGAFLSTILYAISLLFAATVSTHAQENVDERDAGVLSFLDRISPVMVTIPAGRFKVGCVDSADCSSSDPTDEWASLQSFLMSEHEITWDMYQPCIDAGACPENSESGGDNGWGKGSRPVINVNWYDITEHYLPWLNLHTGETFRLPTHREWEYAARGGTLTAYHWGDEVGSNLANCDGCGSQWDGLSTSPVKSFPPNPYGLYDMHGNVSEWTASCSRGPYGRGVWKAGVWVEEDCDSRILTSNAYATFPLFVTVSAFGGKKLHRRGVYGIRLVQDI